MRQNARKRAHPSELTDKIKALRARFEAHRDTGMEANPDGVAFLVDELSDILALAWEFMQELSAHRWNTMGCSVAEAEAMQAIAAAANEPGSNIRLLPALVRAFSDGPSGSAA